MKSRWFSIVIAVAVLVAVMVPVASAEAPAALAVPFHPVNPNYAAIKAQLDARVLHPVAATPHGSANTPIAFLNWQGLGTVGYSPSDATGAIGPTEYIELVNVSIGVYDRSGNLLSSNSDGGLTGFSTASGDGVIMYSAHDQRFYASMLNINGTNYQLIYGFSKGSAPSANASDWCFYTSTFGGRYGANLPDYPKLGDTADFMLMGVNTFDSTLTRFLGGDVAWVQKPAAGVITTCPAQSSLLSGVKRNLLNADGTQASTPNPMKQTDSSSIGYVVANEDPGTGSSTVLSLFSVKKNATTGQAQFTRPKTVTVAAYSYPPSAPQPGTTTTLDTLDARLNSGWAAPDPSHGGKTTIWTGHTVAASSGGLGAEYRWYQINPGTGALIQSGIVQSPSLYVFMGAIAPDRNGASNQFGSNAVMAFNTSSTSALPAGAMASVVGGVQSSIVTVHTSALADTEFTCYSPYGPPCRWGDYSGASPDPASTTAGQVWASVMLANGGTRSTSAWTTWNWGATP